MISNPKDEATIEKAIHTFLALHELSLKDVDIVISGLCGDESRDTLLKYCNENVYTEQSIVGFKHLCGEYMTASSFAVWLGAKMLKTQQVPDSVVLRNTARTPKTILIHNAYKTSHSLILLKQ
jgi:3-oxoacyl-[acyl-carrier-protein] synthase II